VAVRCYNKLCPFAWIDEAEFYIIYLKKQMISLIVNYISGSIWTNNRKAKTSLATSHDRAARIQDEAKLVDFSLPVCQKRHEPLHNGT